MGSARERVGVPPLTAQRQEYAQLITSPRRRTSPFTPQNVSCRSRTSSTIAHERPSGGSPQPPPWPSYSRRVHNLLLRCSLESAKC